MKIDVVSAAGPDALAEVLAGVRSHAGAAFVSIHANADLVTEPVDLQDCALLGATSCLGAMTNTGARQDAAAFILTDPDGAYGAAVEPLGGDPVAAAKAATRAALTMADRVGEKPELIWIAATPGAEESVLAGIESVVGADVPIIGGSAADNDVSGGWSVFNQGERHGSGVAVAVLFPSTGISFAYQNGYSPTGASGVVTEGVGRRVLEIDDRPAAEVYAEWTGGAVALDPSGGDGQGILAASTLWPLGRRVESVGDVPYYLLAHPAAGDASSGTLHFFADITVGETLSQMTGSADSLIARAGRVTRFAMGNAEFGRDEVAGALMIYCGGCMLSVQDRIDDVAHGVDQELDGAPFLGAFTFGEQGSILGSGNRHGNLMISSIIFGR